MTCFGKNYQANVKPLPRGFIISNWSKVIIEPIEIKTNVYNQYDQIIENPNFIFKSVRIGDICEGILVTKNHAKEIKWNENVTGRHYDKPSDYKDHSFNAVLARINSLAQDCDVNTISETITVSI